MMKRGRNAITPSFIKPVNAIALADEVLATELNDETRTDWETVKVVLHGTVTHRRFKSYAHDGNVQEEAMLKYVELCVKLGDLQTMRDGLHFFKSMTQYNNPLSGQKVLEKTISVAEGILEADPENEVNIKLVWECYRKVLDLIKTAAKLDMFYHETAGRAIEFCVKYKRTNEFKRFCELMKWQFQHIQRHKSKSKQQPAGLLRPETFLDTKTKQLEAACGLKLWRNASETVDDLEAHGVREYASKIPNGVNVLNAYYKGQAEVLWHSKGVDSDHAEAIWKLYQHRKRCEPNFSGSEDERKLADQAILSAAASSNSDLMEIISRKNIQDVASVEVTKLLEYLNRREDHHEMCKEVTEKIKAIENICNGDEMLLRYFPKIREIVLTRLITLLQGVYQSISLDHLQYNLVPPEFMPWHAAEFVLLNLSKTGSVSVIIDRLNRMVTFSLSRPKYGSELNILYNCAESLKNIVNGLDCKAKSSAVIRARKIDSFYANIREEITQEMEFFHSRMEHARKILERETNTVKKENDEHRQMDVRRREEMQKMEEDRIKRAADREKELKQQRLLETQRMTIAKKILATVLHEIPNGVTPVKIRGVDIDKIPVEDFAAQKYTFEEVNAAIQKMKLKERSTIRSVREKEEKAVDYTARALKEESIPAWAEARETLRESIEVEAEKLRQSTLEKQAHAYDLLKATTEIVQSNSEDQLNWIHHYIDDQNAQNFAVQWPAFKKIVNGKILKQALLTAEANAPQPGTI